MHVGNLAPMRTYLRLEIQDGRKGSHGPRRNIGVFRFSIFITSRTWTVIYKIGYGNFEYLLPSFLGVEYCGRLL
jgi:hypothetical protein